MLETSETCMTAESAITHLWVCHRNRGHPLYITGVKVHFSAFILPGSALASSFLSISPPFWLDLNRNNFTIEIFNFFLRRM